MSLREQLGRETWQNQPESSSGAVKKVGRRLDQQNTGKDKKISRRESLTVSNAMKNLGRKKGTKGKGYNDLKVILVYGTNIYVVEVDGSHKWNTVQDGICTQTARGCVSDAKVTCEPDHLLEISKQI